MGLFAEVKSKHRTQPDAFLESLSFLVGFHYGTSEMKLLKLFLSVTASYLQRRVVLVFRLDAF